MRGWNQLGVVETIYEEECEFSSTSSPSPSPSFSSSPSSLHSRVEAWSLKTGRETDILIRVQGTCFRLHKDRVVSQSSYLKRHLTETSNLTLSPPLNITAGTFAAVAEFCYNSKVQMTPTNVASIRTAAELLGMTAAGNQEGGEGLSHVAETYFRGVIGINQEYATMVLRSCLPLLPDAETTASLVSRCIEVLVCGHSNLCATRIDDVVVEMQPQDFEAVTESINRRFGNHDVLYEMVDLYLKENKFGKLSEEQKTRICNSIDCTKLSSETLAECVQNPRMPLRFVVRAVLIEHLNTRHSIACASGPQHHHQHQHELQFESNRERQRRSSELDNPLTLRDLLRHDAALRETAQLKKAMDSTNARIQSLEKELRCMNRVLLERKAEDEEEEERNVLGSERSASFHYVENGRIKRDERWSASSSSIQFDNRILENRQVENHPKMTKTFRHRLMTGLKNAFRVPNSRSSIHREKIAEKM
ncbi:BTB/POZ domain-containing protein At3g49900 [Gastrolobium bilobum]|uniref:BTB/POZ domain-containing protein At3g49900 n=1 Tax=Gastrolobium bilobum TaxID=150636 RepID=UPI002AAF3AEF|nr:BTB/POZ domain-containing protein At3g49900 [Gastrolobium bilobum]